MSSAIFLLVWEDLVWVMNIEREVGLGCEFFFFFFVAVGLLKICELLPFVI